MAAAYPIGRVNAFFLTHFHSDHTNGLADLWLTGWLQPAYGQRHAPMELYGPKGTDALASGLQQAYATDIATRVKDEGTPLDGVKINSHEVTAGVVYDQDGVKVTAFDNDHGSTSSRRLAIASTTTATAWCSPAIPATARKW